MLKPSDFLDLVGVEDPQISPDGRTIVFVRSRLNLEKNRIERSLWRYRKGPSEPFTQGVTDRAPRWSTDGRSITFLRTDDDKQTSLFVMAADGGEPRPIAGPFARMGPAAFSPDCTRVAFAAAIDMAPDATTVAFDEEAGARHATALPYKSDAIGLFDGKRMQVHVATLSGDVKAVAQGAFDAGNPVWSPDGRRLVFLANRGVREASFANDLYAVSPEGGELVRLTSMDGMIETPSFSRDGRELAMIGYPDEEYAGRRNPQLWCVSAEGGKPRSLTPDRAFFIGDATISDLRTHDSALPFWMPDDQEIVVQRSHEGTCTLYAYKRDGSGGREVVGGDIAVYAFTGARDGTLAIAKCSMLDPGSIARVRIDGAIDQPPNENLAWLESHPPIVPERIRPKAKDGTQLDAWVIRSPYPAAPLVHAVHGGPHAAYGVPYFFEFQLLAALGMHVVFGNPRGSQSYGEAYADAITGDWGGLDASDVDDIRAAAIAHLGVDPKRVGIQGGSYGGFMTTWMLGHSEAYACGVSMRAVNDHLSETTVNDIPRFLERELKLDWSDGGKRHFERSPMRGAPAIEAPLLIMHSERDFRCPVDQGEQLFGLLRQLGKTAEYVRFSGDGHDLSRTGTPRNRLLRYRALCHWLRRYLGVANYANVGAGWLFEPVDGEAASSVDGKAEAAAPQTAGV